MICYLVGGAVRDIILGIDPTDKDYVVIGSSPEEMISLGFRQVGADFPVFLHPETGEEYALARTERKVASGYHGFIVDSNPTITLKDDLSRRDCTMNSLAMDESTGEIFDYFGGIDDLKNGIIRHTSDAFKEDPVRILRVARFAARYGFEVHSTTYQLMDDMVSNGEFDSLVPERVWAEFEKGLMEKQPLKMFQVLNNCCALSRLGMYSNVNLDALLSACDANESFEIRCAAMFANKTKEEFEMNRIPSNIAELAMTADLCSVHIRHTGFQTTRMNYLDFFYKVDLFRKQERFWKALTVLKHRGIIFPEIGIEFAHKILAVDCGAVALQCDDKSKIRDAVYQARLDAMIGDRNE